MFKLSLLTTAAGFFLSFACFARDPIIVWPTEIGKSGPTITSLEGSWITIKNESEAWSLKITKEKTALKVEAINAEHSKDLFIGVLNQSRKAYFGELQDPHGRTLHLLIYKNNSGLRLRVFEAKESFEDYELHKASEVTSHSSN